MTPSPTAAAAALLLSSFSFAVAPAAGAEPAERTLDPAIYNHVVHVGWVVADMEPVLGYWRRIGLRIGEPEPLELSGVEYRGERVPVSLKIARTSIGGVGIEWIEPVGDGRNVYTEFLERHGDGVHHLAYAVPSAERLEEELRGFAAKGVGAVQRGSWQGQKGEGRFAYLDTAPRGGGLTFELVFDPDADGAAAAESPAHAPPFGRIVQYAVVVKDLEAVSDFYASLGYGGFRIDPPSVLDDLEYRGQPRHYSMSLGWDRRGDVAFEWIQSEEGPNVYEEVLEQRGEGFHHLGFDVEDMDAAIARFAALGVPVTQSGAWNFPSSHGRYAYVETELHGGVMVELLWNDPDWPE